MDNKMIEVKDTFWNKLKWFLQNIILRNKNNFTNSEIRCSEKDDGQTYTKRYICVGEKEASFINANWYQTKRFTLYGYRTSHSSVRSFGFSEKVRDKNFDKQISKTTKQGEIEEITRGPLLNLDNEQYMGRYERKEIKYENGNRTIEDNKEIIDENGKPTEALNMIGQDGKVDLSNGVANMDKKYVEYDKALERAGLPQNLANMLDKTYEEHIPQFELKEFDIAKEQLNKQEQTQMLVRGNQEQMER